MMHRREVISGAILAGALISSPASACRAPVPKDRKGYARAIDNVFVAWWARDFDAFLAPFRNPDREETLPNRTLFDAHFGRPELRFRGDILFNGASAVVQVITPQGNDYAHGFCGGYARSEIFLVKFYPGASGPVIEKIIAIDQDLLARGEWEQLPGAPKLKDDPYWKVVAEPKRE
jgi:hypothetical protein